MIKSTFADVVLISPDAKLLCLLRTNNDDIAHSKWCLPGGHVDDTDENDEQAALRELKEETGVILDMAVPIGDATTEKGEKIAYFLGFCDRETSRKVVCDIEEHQGYAWMTLEEISQSDFLFDLKDRLLNELMPLAHRLFVSTQLQSQTFVLNPEEFIAKFPGFISTDYTVTVTDSILNKGLDEEELNEQRLNYLEGIITDHEWYEIKKAFNGDPSHGGKLVKVKKKDSNGKTVTKWVSKQQAESSKDKSKSSSTSKSNSKKSEDDSFNIPSYTPEEHAKNAHGSQLERHAIDNSDPSLREVAFNELKSRQDNVKNLYRDSFSPVSDNIEEIKSHYQEVFGTFSEDQKDTLLKWQSNASSVQNNLRKGYPLSDQEQLSVANLDNMLKSSLAPVDMQLHLVIATNAEDTKTFFSKLQREDRFYDDGFVQLSSSPSKEEGFSIPINVSQGKRCLPVNIDGDEKEMTFILPRSSLFQVISNYPEIILANG